MENDQAPAESSGAVNEKPQKPTVPITIDVESDEDTVQQQQDQLSKEPAESKPTELKELEQTAVEKEAKAPLVIPVDEDEEDSTPTKEGEVVGDGEGIVAVEKKTEEENGSPRKKRVPEVISVDEDDEDEKLQPGKSEVSAVKEPESTSLEMEVEEKPVKVPETISLDETEMDVLLEAKAAEGSSESLKMEVQPDKVHVKGPEVIAVDETEDMDLEEEKKSTVEEIATKKVPEVISIDEGDSKDAEEQDVAKKLSPKESEVEKELSNKKPEVISVDEIEDKVTVEEKESEMVSSKSPEVASKEEAQDMDVEEKEETSSSAKESHKEKAQPTMLKVISLDETEDKEKDKKTPEQECSNTSEDADKRVDEENTAEKPKDVPAEEKQKDVEAEANKELEEKASEKDQVISSVEATPEPKKTDNEQNADDDIILIEDEKDSSEKPKRKNDDGAVKSGETSKGADYAKVQSTTEENTKDLKGEEAPAPTEKLEDNKTKTVENDSKKDAQKSSENPTDAKSKTIVDVDQDDDDVMMVDSEPSSEKNEKKTEVTADKIDNDNEEVMMVDSDSNQMETDSGEVANKPSPEDAKRKESDISKDKPKEVEGGSQAKGAEEVVPSSTVEEPNKSGDEGDKKSLETDKPNEVPREKTYVLDEKLGIFQEKDAPPEEKITQLITGDSDEDVVMIEDDPPKKAVPKPVEVKKAPILEKKISKENKPKTVSAQNIDCINAECRKESKETAPAPSFVLNFYGIPKKSKKQRICVICYDEVVVQYSDLCGRIVDQQPLLFCDMPRKNELVEISDSSEEEEDEETKLETGKPVSSDIISLVESELNDILTSTFEKINLSQQIDWTEQIMKQKIAYNTKISDEINNELNELQRKVDRIHLQLYSKSRPRYQELPPCNIFHEVDLLNKNQSANSTQSTGTGPNRQYSPQRPYAQTGQQTAKQQQTLPVSPGSQQSTGAKKEEFIRPAVVVGQFYFAVKHKLLSNWSECQVVEAVNLADKALYKVNFLYNQGAGSAPIKVVPSKYLAYRHSFNVKLPLGTRVIARFDAGTTHPSMKPSQQAKANAFYPGIIAESFGKYNRHRYLIFFDDGYAQYVGHGDVRVVCEESKDVWTDIHPHSQEFIRNYLMNYRSQRPMVQVKVGQRIITEWKGKWIYAKVVDIDASLVQLHFPDDNRFEWIYRGSTRLGPLYQEKALSMSKMSNNKFSKFQKRNEPSIEYITLDDDEEDPNKEQEPKKATPQEQALQSYHQQNKNFQHNQQVSTLNQADAAEIRSVAKKSTFNRTVPSTQPSAVFMNSSTIYCEDDRPKGKIVYYTAKKHLPPLKYKPHECTPGCLFKITHNLKSYSPLAKPLLSGWERQLCKMKYKKVFVVYRAPCGRRVRNMYELHKYIRMTKATLNVENFDFDPMVHCLAEYVIENHIYHNPDLSDGKEFMAVPCVNYFDDTKPPPCIYSTERIPSEGVKLNLDTDFLCGCDCEDDCLDKTRCQCWQLTIAGAKFGNPNTSVDNIGYVYKRLQETVVTGIYECNARCKCKTNCLNRVVQHPLQTKLQVFKTSNRGWGIRCLNDVSKGSFICIYSGHLLTEETGNDICLTNENKAGDEYFADLDYIETVEQLKEGYETDVVESESDNDSDEPDYEARRDSDASDDDFTSNANPSNAAVKTRSQIRRESTKRTELKKPTKKKDDSKNGSDDEREMVNLVPNSDMTKGESASPSIKYRSVRKLFGKHEQIYIMDAKKSGNLGRYFNHSCNPNLFVQNVFVDTHDLRFPWVAFFALCNIRAGSELTWNYNYDVGSVPGKVLYCQCGAENCRQRLL